MVVLISRVLIAFLHWEMPVLYWDLVTPLFLLAPEECTVQATPLQFRMHSHYSLAPFQAPDQGMVATQTIIIIDWEAKMEQEIASAK